MFAAAARPLSVNVPGASPNYKKPPKYDVARKSGDFSALLYAQKTVVCMYVMHSQLRYPFVAESVRGRYSA